MIPELPISSEDWGNTPPAVQAFVMTLWERVQALEAEVQGLRSEVVLLREQLGQTSQNSSRPPSTDPPEAPKRKGKSSGRRPGGQPGHEGVSRTLKSVEEVDEVVVVKPERCAHCGAQLMDSDPYPTRHQVTEVPPIRATVTEYQLHTLHCAACGGSTRAELPEGVPRGAFGPRVQALAGLFSGAYRMSTRNLHQMLSDCFGVELGLGSIFGLEQTTSEAIVEPVDEAKAYVKEQSVVNIDETGWRQENGKAWLWTAVTAWVTVFAIRWSRGSQVVKELLGDPLGKVVGSDRFSAYSFLPVLLRQICWAHLVREFQAFVDRGGESAQIGQALLTQTDQMFDWWYRVRDRSVLDYLTNACEAALQGDPPPSLLPDVTNA